MGKQTNEEVTELVYATFLAMNSWTLLIRMLSFLLVQGECLHMGDLFPDFEEKFGGRVQCFLGYFFPPAISQVT